MRKLATIAVTCYAAGYTLGTLICEHAWRLTTGEHRYRIGTR